MATLIIHPGSPKTATSCIQHVLDRNKPAIESLPERTRVLTIRDFRGHPILKAFMEFYRGKTPNLNSEVIKDFFDGMNDRYDKIIISEETFCLDFMPSKKLSFGGIDKVEKSIEFINAIPIEKKKIVLTIRKQTGLLVSSYTHSLHRRRETLSFANWIETEVNCDNLSWLKVVEHFDDSFGHENVIVVPLEASKLNGISGYVNSVLSGFELDSASFDTSIVDVHNPSPSLRAVNLIRTMNKEIQHVDKSVKVNNALIKHFPVAEFGKFNPSHRIMDLVSKKYSTENSTLAERKFPHFAKVFS